MGRAEHILDANGGTDVFQMSPRRLELTAGTEHVACMRVTEKGALRFYAACCKTPIAHTLPSAAVPFMAINHACVRWDGVDAPRHEVIGPVRARINGAFTREEATRLGATRWALLKMLGHYVPLFLWWFVRGDAKHSPLFDAKTGRAIREPERIGLDAIGSSQAREPRVPRNAVPSRGCG